MPCNIINDFVCPRDVKHDPEVESRGMAGHKVLLDLFLEGLCKVDPVILHLLCDIS